MNGFDNQHDHESYRQLLQCWQAENNIKTIKFQFLLLSNAILVGIASLNNDIIRNPVWLYSIASLLSLAWLFSIGRTLLFQKAWQIRLRQMAEAYPDDQRFHVLGNSQALALIKTKYRWLALCGALPSRLYLLGLPVILLLGWLTALLNSL